MASFGWWARFPELTCRSAKAKMAFREVVMAGCDGTWFDEVHSLLVLVCGMGFRGPEWLGFATNSSAMESLVVRAHGLLFWSPVVASLGLRLRHLHAHLGQCTEPSAAGPAHWMAFALFTGWFTWEFLVIRTTPHWTTTNCHDITRLSSPSRCTALCSLCPLSVTTTGSNWHLALELPCEGGTAGGTGIMGTLSPHKVGYPAVYPIPYSQWTSAHATSCIAGRFE